jgi:hypothetical protein
MLQWATYSDPTKKPRSNGALPGPGDLTTLPNALTTVARQRRPVNTGAALFCLLRPAKGDFNQIDKDF